MASITSKKDCNINELANILSGLNIESIANINFTSKISIFGSRVKNCMNADNEIDFYIQREELNGEDLRLRIIKLYRELSELLNEIENYCRTAYSHNIMMTAYKQRKARLALNINDDPEFIKAQHEALNKIPFTKRWKNTPINQRETIVKAAMKKLTEDWEARRNLEKRELGKQYQGVKELLKSKLYMEAELKKIIVLHMKDIGGKRDYTEKLAGFVLKHYYEMSYHDSRNIERNRKFIKIKFRKGQWLKSLKEIVEKIKEWDDYRRAQNAQRNADELIAEETVEQLERERKIEREREKREKEEKLKHSKTEQKVLKRNSATKIQRAFRNTRKKSMKKSINKQEVNISSSNEQKQSSLQRIDDIDRSIIDRIKELYGYLMEEKIFIKYRKKRERILTVLISYHTHLLTFMKEILIPQLEQKNIRVVVTGGFATALLTGKYKTEDVDMKLYLIKKTGENNANFKMRNIVKTIIENNLQFLNTNQEELKYELYEPSRNPLENNGDFPVKITGKINEEKGGKRENPRVTGDFDAVGELTFSAKEYDGNLIDVRGIPVLSPEILIDNLLNQASNNFRERIESGERNIYPEKLLGWMKQLQALLRLKNPDAANELSKELDRMKSPSPKQGGKRKKKRKTRKKRRKKKTRRKRKKTLKKRKKNRKKLTRRK